MHLNIMSLCCATGLFLSETPNWFWTYSPFTQEENFKRKPLFSGKYVIAVLLGPLPSETSHWFWTYFPFAQEETCKRKLLFRGKYV